MRATTKTTVALTVLVTASSLFTGCATMALGRPPGDVELQNDGSDDAQSDLVRKYEVVYDRGMLRRPGADPAQVGAEVHVNNVTDVATPAWSDDAYNYLSSSEDAAEVMEHPSIGFDQFAHSGTGEIVILGVGAGSGIVAGAITWFIPTRIADGISVAEQADLSYGVVGGFSAGLGLGLIVAAAYTYIVPAVSSPFATPLYRKAARAFNDDLEQRILEAAPSGDPPEVPEAAPTTTETTPPTTTETTPAPVETPPAPTPATTTTP